MRRWAGLRAFPSAGLRAGVWPGRFPCLGLFGECPLGKGGVSSSGCKFSFLLDIIMQGNPSRFVNQSVLLSVFAQPKLIQCVFKPREVNWAPPKVNSEIWS